MSQNGQSLSAPTRDPAGRPLPSAERPVVGYARDYSDIVIDWHRHDCAQLLYATSGLMRVEAVGGLWIVPPQRAVWVPAGTAHRVQGVGEVAMRSLYIHAGLPGLSGTCQVIAVSPLLRELILEMARRSPGYAGEGPEGRLAAVILDLLRIPGLPVLHLPIPAERRLQPIVRALLDDPADRRDLADWARVAGASERTILRLFAAETGLGFREWRTQLRLHEALARLVTGEAVTEVAFAVGYESPSAFIAMFRRALGESPLRYLDRAALPEGAGDRKQEP